MAMITLQISQVSSKTYGLGVVLCIGFGWLAACSSVDEAPGGGRIEHPVELGPKIQPSPSALATTLSSSSPSSSTSAPSAPLSSKRRSISEYFEENTGLKLSPRDKAIMDDCPDRAWSKNVPKRQCSKDEQCGDGFCDRGRCAAFWTCRGGYGIPCEKDAHCSSYRCVDGRCRSCVSDAECKWESDHQDPKCIDEPSIPGSRGCVGVTGGFKDATIVGPGAATQSPKK